MSGCVLECPPCTIGSAIYAIDGMVTIAVEVLSICEGKEAKLIAREKVRKVQMVPLPSPYRVTPFSTLNATPISPSPTLRERSIIGDTGQEEDDLEDLNSFRLPVLERALLGSDFESLGEFIQRQT
jgi:hypothetical protein